jgi:ABC-2 type transport system ATP-binding protein
MLIEFKNVKKRYGSKTVLSDVSFEIKEGEIFGLIGTSGSGKTTIFKILIGICPIDGGSVLFQGKNALRNLKTLRKNTGFATQRNTLFEELSLYENSMYFARLYGMKKKNIKLKFEELTSLLGLKGFENYLVKNLSGGMIKRANLLVSLIHDPYLLVLDEPTVGLDPLLRKTLWDYIKQINKSGTTIVVTSHLLEEMEENCNRVGILGNGKILSIDTPEGYKNKYGKELNFNKIFRAVLNL